jgi:hypothetical protein
MTNDADDSLRIFPQAETLDGPPQQWDIPLKDGETLTVLAHGYHIENNLVIFSLLFKGTPSFEIDTLRIPISYFADDYFLIAS